MKIDKDKGFIHKSISNNYGSSVVTMRGTGFNNDAYSYINVNNVEVFRNATSGLSLIRFDRYMNFIDATHYNIADDFTEVSRLTEKLYDLGDNMYFAIISYGEHIDVPIMKSMDAKGFSTIHRNFSEVFETHKTPYCCFGTGKFNKNNTPTVIYEARGRWEENATDPHAILSFTVCEPETISLNQCSDNYLKSSHATNSKPLDNVSFKAQYNLYEYKIRGRVSSPSSNGIVEAIFKVNDNVYSSVKITHELFQEKSMYIQCEVNDRIDVEFITSGEYDVTYIGLFNKLPLDIDDKRQTISPYTLGCKRNKISLYGYDYTDMNHFYNNYGNPLYSTNNRIHIGDNDYPTTLLRNEIVNSRPITVDNDKNYALFGYFKGDGREIKITISQYSDSNNMTLVDTVFDGIITNRTGVLAIPIYGKNSKSQDKFYTGYYLEDGYEINTFDDKNTIKLLDDTQFITVTVEGSCNTYMKVVDMIWSFNNDGVIYGNITLG